MVYLSSKIETPDAWYIEFVFCRDFDFLNDSIKLTLFPSCTAQIPTKANDTILTIYINIIIIHMY